MAIQFVLGRAGTGKTWHCFESIEAWVRRHGLSASVILLTPRQATQVAERQLVARTAGRSLLGVRVVSPDSLVREVAPQLAESLELLDGRGRRLLIAMAIQQLASELQYFLGAEHQPNLAAKIDAALAEIEHAGATMAEVRGGLGALVTSADKKLADLALIQEAYARLLGERLDRHRLEARVIDAIRASKLVSQSLVVVDGFADFTPMQRRMLAALGARAQRMQIALLLDGANDGADEASLFSRTARTYRRMLTDFAREKVAVESPLVLAAQHRFTSPDLAQLEAQFDAAAAPEAKAGEGRSVRIVEAASDLEEVRFAAEEIRRWQIAGVRLRQIGVFCRDLQPYAPWVRPIFAEYGLASFIDQKRSLSEHPLMRYVRAALRIAMDGWRRLSVLDMLKCGLSPLTAEEADRLENFALRHGIDRQGWLEEWDYLSAPVAEDEKADEKREREESRLCSEYRYRVLAVLGPLTQAWSEAEIPATQLTSAMRGLIDSDSVTAHMKIWSSSEETGQEHTQCMDELRELLAAADLLLGESKLPPRQIAEMLLAAMEEMSVKLAPPTLDQVLVGQIDRSRSPEFERVILLGMNEGAFPARANEDSIFSDAERCALEKAGVELNADSATKAIAEQLTGYIAMTRASHELILTRPRTDEAGRKLAASGFISHVQRLLPHVAVEQATFAINPKAAAGRQLASLYINEAKLEASVARELLGDELNCSATRLECFAGCPFRHFLERSLRLQIREEAEISSLDLGNAFHNVLQELGARMVKQKLDWSSTELTEHIEALVEQVSKELRGQVLLSSARNSYLLGVIKRMLLKLVNDQKLLSASGYSLSETELSFGEDTGLPALMIHTPKGRKVRLRGRIDRVDCREEGQSRSYLIFDYKTSEKRLALAEVEKGLSLQLMIYWLVMQENGREVDAALYQQLMRPMKTEKAPKLTDAEAVSCKPRGLLRFEAKDRLDPGLDGRSKLYGLYVKSGGAIGHEGSSDAIRQADLAALQAQVRGTIGELADAIFDGNIDIAPYQIRNRSACTYCDFRAVCRFDTCYNKYHVIEPAKRTEVLDRINPARVMREPVTTKKKGKKS